MLDGEYVGENWETPGRQGASDFFQPGLLRLGDSGFGNKRTVDLSDVRSFQRLLTETEVHGIYLENGVDRTANGLDPTDNRILYLSIAAGFDLTPLIHFWGIHPVDPAALQAAIQAEN